MKKLIFYLIGAVAVMLLNGCVKKEISDDFFAMDTYMTATVYGTEADLSAVREEVYRLDNLLKRGNIDRDNQEVKGLIEESLKISEFTDGAFDITVAPFLDRWGFWTKEYRIPRSSEIDRVLEITGYEKLYENSCEIDFGAIGKGYAGDCVKAILKECGVESAVISLGGNVQTIGLTPDGEPWRVGIKNPDGEGYVGYVQVSDAAVVTSGGYERYFEKNGVRYSHIIDPKTGRPADTDVKSATVISEDGSLADGLSTAFYVMGRSAAERLCEASGCKMGDLEFSVIIIDESGEIRVLGNTNFREIEK